MTQLEGQARRGPFAYERVMQRLIAQNAMLWSTPSLGLAAQACLLTTSLNVSPRVQWRLGTDAATVVATGL